MVANAKWKLSVNVRVEGGSPSGITGDKTYASRAAAIKSVHELLDDLPPPDKGIYEVLTIRLGNDHAP